MISPWLKPASKNIALSELNVGRIQAIFINRYAFIYYINFDAIYALIAAALAVGLLPTSVGTRVGSVLRDGIQLLSVTSIAQLELIEDSFYYDFDTRTLYIHLVDGDRPSLHVITLGIIYGITNRADVYDESYYEGRLLNTPKLTKMRDLLFFGLVAFGGGELEVDNKPDPGETSGPFDTIGKDNDIFGHYTRMLFGFDDQEYSEFSPVGHGLIESISVGEERMRVSLRDFRATFVAGVPDRVFDLVTYPGLADNSVGQPIPVAYGVLRNISATCVNETAVAPGAYDFVFADTTYHSMHAISEVRVVGVAVVPVATDLAAGTFSLDPADYAPGQDVTLDCEGYEDGAGDPIVNALDVVRDLLTNYQALLYTASTYNQTEWTAARNQCADVCFFGNKSQELKKIVEQICTSARVNIVMGDDLRLTAFKFDANALPVQTFGIDDMRSIPMVSYDSSEVLSRVLVGYNRDWSNDKSQYYLYDAQEATVFSRYKIKRPKTFDTLLTNEADALAFAVDIMAISGVMSETFLAEFKMQPFERDVGHVVRCAVTRRSGSGLVGDVRAEILEVDKNLIAATITLRCRIMSEY